MATLQAAVGLKTAVIVGGIDMMSQAIALQAKPHVLVVRGPPGGVGGSLRRLRGRRRPAASWTTWRTPRASTVKYLSQNASTKRRAWLRCAIILDSRLADSSS